MGITFDNEKKIFHIRAKDTSYILQIFRAGFPVHLYWGKAIRNSDLSRLLYSPSGSFSPNSDPKDHGFSLDTIMQEYPSFGSSDYRHPAYQVQLENGSTITDLKYNTHRIYKGKKKLEGLPSTYVEKDSEADTLEIELIDSLIGLKVILTYTAFKGFDAITRSVKLLNEGTQDLKILRALSMCVDFVHSDYDFMHLSGAWARERHIHRRSIKPGMQSVESRRGASSHQQNPFIALLGKETDEDHGEAYGFNLVYSGSFVAQVEVDQMNSTRVSIGINPFDFTWLLKPGESFQTPESVLVYSSEGLGKMSQTYHKLYRTRLCRGKFRDKYRPVLINNWEATYFDFNAEKILNIARAAKDVGIELFVLDDGWFGKRNNDKTSLGDWFINKEKLPEGLDSLAKKVNEIGLDFGLWFEPEMISPDSELYRKHPDWCIHVPGRTRSEGRNQLVLDLSRREICNEIIKMLKGILSTVNISYVKWDMNRHITEMGSLELPPERQRETAHRYILGLYYILEEITKEYPDILFESCSGGGGRFDPGMLFYMPQVWASDDTDAIERLKIQFGTSIAYPACTMGAHVSAVPNHQVQRITPLETRGHVALSGVFGYELDATKFTDEEKEVIKKQIELYKEVRHITFFGEFYRLLSSFEKNEAAWMYVTEDKKEALVTYVKVLGEPFAPFKVLKMKGLNPNYDYLDIESNIVYGGDELMYMGINVPGLKDFESCIWRLKAVELTVGAPGGAYDIAGANPV